MDWLIDNPGQGLITLGFILLIIEMLVLGFSTFVLTFVGLSAIVSGIAISIGLIPGDLFSILISNALLASVFAALLWKPLKRFQNKQDTHVVKNDLIGIEFQLAEDIGGPVTSKQRMSGVDWAVKSEQSISSGTMVVVEKTDVGTLWVKAI